ncbi:hypothetical protein F4801DRAFT_268640 [Xylaria longipes]|nr:hypothetical protein F4801DRAFT_268640 [Xylaria longipes]RYC61463.1 hypothetical protein CHU98_g4731 [Xylaria longipes]
MASLQSISSFGPHGTKYKIGKSKPKSAVKPILKKWSQSEKEKKSVDLDRGWDEQDVQHRSTQGWGRSSSLSFYDQASGNPDAVTTVVGVGTPGTGGVGVGLGVLGSATTTRRYNHSRSISGTSHASGTTNNSSNGIPAPRQAGATFVHPFQQTPRTSTPPLLSYANSLASIADTRDYSPTIITEDDNDDSGDLAGGIETQTNQQHPNSSGVYSHHTNYFGNSNSLSQPTLMLQPLGSQCTSSTDISDTNSPKPPPQPPLRISTSRTSSIPTHSSRLANVSSRSDLRLDRIVDSPVSPSKAPATVTSPSSSIPPMSPLLRTSLDGAFPRLRAKSDLDTATRAEHLRAARRKFEIKERAKDEKYAREEIKRRERLDNKRALELEKRLAAHHKEQLAAMAREEAAELEEALQRGKHNRKISVASSGRPSLSIPRPSLSLGRPSMSRKNTSNQMGESEKFMSSAYNSTGPRSPPTHGMEAGTAHSVRFTSPKRKSKAKKKTQGAWTAFILWLRTKLLRIGKN